MPLMRRLSSCQSTYYFTGVRARKISVRRTQMPGAGIDWLRFNANFEGVTKANSHRQRFLPATFDLLPEPTGRSISLLLSSVTSDHRATWPCIPVCLFSPCCLPHAETAFPANPILPEERVTAKIHPNHPKYGWRRPRNGCADAPCNPGQPHLPSNNFTPFA